MNHRLFCLFSCGWLWLLLDPSLSASAPTPPDARIWTSLRSELPGLSIAELVPPTLEYSELRWSDGDDPRWAQADWDDSAWNRTSGRTIPSHRGVFWIRFHVRDGSRDLPGAAFIWSALAYDFYWDGLLIGRSGKPANRFQDEVPGLIDSVFTLPEVVRSRGEHVVAMRVSNYRNGFPSALMPFDFILVPFVAYQEFDRHSGILPTMAVGAMLMAMLTCLVMWLLAARRAVLLLLAMACLCAASMQATLVIRLVCGYTYDWLYPAVLASRVSLDALALGLAALVIVQCRLPRWSWLGLAAIAALTRFSGWLSVLATHCVTLLLMASVVGAGWAMGRGRRGARLVFAGLLITTLLWLYDSRHFMNTSFLMDFLPTFVGLISAIALDLKDERRRARDTQLTAARLEVELLKKNLQPHFVLNTLTALTEVIEQNPPQAVRLIEDLAEEFRAFARIAGEKQVPLSQELELCRTHLRVLSLRTGATYALDTCGVDEAESVPPGLFLTLVENGFVHQDLVQGAGTFSLRMTRRDAAVRYIFRSAGPVRHRIGRAPGGTGLRYVKARLEESFPGNWRVISASADGAWQTTIELQNS